MKTILLLAVSVALAATWVIERFSTSQLTAAIDAQRGQQRELLDLQRERDRLRALQPAAGELESQRRATAESARLQNEIDVPPATPSTPPAALPIGQWTPAREWKNRGQATPHAAVETALWAAAGGDVFTLRRLLSVGDDTRQAADSLLAKLPAETRALYPTPEDLISAFTIKNIPLGEAQLVWFNQRGENDATVGLFLQRPPMPGEAAAPDVPQPETPLPLGREETARLALQQKADRAAHPERQPPRAPDDQRTSVTYLSLHRDGPNWQLVVPPDAVAQIARELATTPRG